MSRGPDAATLLARALSTSAEARGCPVRIAAHDWTRWASATFSGARHVIIVSGAADDALSQWLADLPEQDFALRGHLVADLTVETVLRDPGAIAARLEILTVEER